MKINNFYTSWFGMFLGIYLLFFLRYIFLFIKLYINKEILQWEWLFLLENLKTTFGVCFPCFIIHWLLYKLGTKKYRK